MPHVKFYQPERDEQVALAIHKFLGRLWGNEGRALRDELFRQTDANAVKAALEQEGLHFVPPATWNAQFILVDVEGGRTKNIPEPIDQTKPWYVLVLPPKPNRGADGNLQVSEAYRDMQAWKEAVFHATNDGYGM